MFLLSISISGCSIDLNNNSSTSRNKISHTNVPTGPSTASLDSSSKSSNKTSDANVSTSPSSSSLNSNSENTKAQMPSVLDAYKSVLQNKTEFFSADSNKKLYLNDFLTNKEIYDTIFTVTHFTVLDMDGDKVPEVVLELSVGHEPQFYEVLHYMDDTVYGYLIVYRGLERLKADGTFNYSNSAADTGIEKMKFGSDAFKTDILGYSESSQGGIISYFINNKRVEKVSLDSFINEQSKKKDAVWYEYSQQIIKTKLSANP